METISWRTQMRMSRQLLLMQWLWLLWLPWTLAGAEQQFRVVDIVRGLQNPWGMAFMPDGDLLITEKAGRLRLLRAGELLTISGTPPVALVGQGGLLDVALHPDFADNGWVYLSLSTAYDGGIGTTLVRGRISAALQFVEVETIYRMPAPGTGGQHFGSRIAFDGQGYVYLTIGDRGQDQRAQDLSRAEGKLLRLHDDGRIPDDNPFVGVPGALGEIFSYGHRNAQGLFYDTVHGRLWLNEHGPQGGDALHIIRGGANYGWPIATYGVQYGSATPIGVQPHQLDYVDNPYTYWVPTSIAPSGLTLYRGHALPRWRGDLFMGALAQQHIQRVVPGEGSPVLRQELLRNAYGRVRAVVSGPDELIYFITDSATAALYRIEPFARSWWFAAPPTDGWRDTASLGGRMGHVYDAYWPWIRSSLSLPDSWLYVVQEEVVTSAAPDRFYAWRSGLHGDGWFFVYADIGWYYDFSAARFGAFTSQSQALNLSF
jgi:aldose sugar dehydrogenase